MLDKINSIYKEFKSLIKDVSDNNEVEEIRIKFLGKNGLITAQAKKIATVSNEIRREFGQKVNEIKAKIAGEIEEIKASLSEAKLEAKLQKESIDVTLPGRGGTRGRIHPIAQTIKLIKGIFYCMGFEHVVGPDVDNEWNNFTALNIPENHPARQMHDTFYLEGHEKLLLRTHTSTVQIRHMMQLTHLCFINWNAWLSMKTVACKVYVPALKHF